MSNTGNEHIEEQQRVTEVTSLIRNRLEKIGNDSGKMNSEIVDIKTHFWDDVTINFEDSTETAETYASMKQQAELLSERERSHRVLQDQVRVLRKLEQSAYFGRIDLVDEEGDQEPIYLGVGSLLDDTGENYLVYDWRAPISSVYYDHGPGPISYQTPNGTIDGEMTLKRQYIIKQGELLSMFDTGVTIGDEILQDVLGKYSDAQMKSIVATIQHEQNRIIRNEQAKLLIVQGAAGSGKTSAALQRVAYLLYRYRESLLAEQIVLFSPNPMFNSYVSTVLPELGEQNMEQTTYQQYLAHRLGKKFALEDPFTQMEYCLSAYDDPMYDARIEGIKSKAAASFMNAIDEYVIQLARSDMKFKNIMFRGKVLISKQEIYDKFYEDTTFKNIPNRLRDVTGWILKELTRLGKLEQKESWVDEEIELLDTEQYANAFEKLSGKRNFSGDSFNDFDAERNFLAEMVVQSKMKKLRRQVKLLRYIDITAMYINLYKSYYHLLDLGSYAKQIASRTVAKLQKQEMPYEDATPYLYLKEKLEGFYTNTAVKYVFIDEGQDYSPFQLHYLKRIFPRSKMTILGDVNQSIFVHSSSSKEVAPFEQLFTEEETERIELLRSYRSTKEIIEYTAQMIDGGEHIIPFNRHGKAPTATEIRNKSSFTQVIDDKLHNWIRNGYASIAIICKTAKESQQVYQNLKERWKLLKLVNQDTVTFERGIMVIPAYLAKGVEFDAVIIYDASATQYYRESERKLFYTACTRAMHELQIYYMNEQSPFLPTVKVT